MTKAQPRFETPTRSALALVTLLMGACTSAHLGPDARWTTVTVAELASSRSGAEEGVECAQPPDHREPSEQAALLRWRDQIRMRILHHAASSGWSDVQLGDIAIWPRGGIAAVRHAEGELFLAATYERYHSVTALCGWRIEPTTEPWKLEHLRAHSELQARLVAGATLVHVELGPVDNAFVPIRYTLIDAEGEARTYTHEGSTQAHERD
ncbi:MAG: hypothetical protein AB8H86_18400 [Polyangiales bacterium]